MPHSKVRFVLVIYVISLKTEHSFGFTEVAQIKVDWSTLNHIVTLQELEEAAELACANLLDSVKYMHILMSSLPQSDDDASFRDWLSALSRKEKSCVTLFI